MTPWDDDKSDFEDRPDVPDDEKLPAEEWNNHVSDGHWDSTDLNLGTDGDGNPVLTDPQNNDSVVATYNRSEGTWELDSISTEETDTTELDRLKIDERNMRDFTQVGHSIDNFEDLSGWTAVDGEIQADTNRFFRGTQSMYATQGTDSSITLEKDVNLDLTKGLPAIAMRHSPNDAGTYHNDRTQIYFYDDSGDWVRFRAGYKTLDDGDQRLRHQSVAMRGESGNPDITNITKIRIAPYDNNATDEWWFDDLRLTPTPEKGRLIIHLDANNEVDQYARDLLTEHGYPVRFNTRIDEVTESEWDEYATLRDDYGWLMGPHGYYRPENIYEFDEGKQREDYEKSISELLDRGHRVGARHRSYLQGSADQSAYDIGQEYHLTGRSGDQLGPIGVPSNPMIVPSETMDDGLTTEVEERLELLGKYGGYGTLFGHPDHRLGQSDLRDFVDKIRSLETDNKIEVVSVERAYNEWASFNDRDSRRRETQYWSGPLKFTTEPIAFREDLDDTTAVDIQIDPVSDDYHELILDLWVQRSNTESVKLQIIQDDGTVVSSGYTSRNLTTDTEESSTSEWVVGHTSAAPADMAHYRTSIKWQNGPGPGFDPSGRLAYETRGAQNWDLQRTLYAGEIQLSAADRPFGIRIFTSQANEVKARLRGERGDV